MRRVYNYNTGKLYESDGTYTITVTEKALSPDVEVNPDDNGEIDQKYLSYDEAVDALDEIVDELCENEGFNREDADIVETDDGFCVTVPEYKQWCFVISGDVTESVNEGKKEKGDVSEKNESVSTRFSKLREMFESAGLNEEDDDEKDDKDRDSDNDDNKNDETGKSDDEKKDSEDDDEEKEMKAIVITVKKGDEDKCKEELIEAGVADEDIEILDGEEDDENVDIRIDVNSVFELKDYLEKKGIDLEEEIGGEIVDDSDDDDSNGDDDSDDDNNGDDGDADFNFDDLGDLFGADEGDE